MQLRKAVLIAATAVVAVFVVLIGINGPAPTPPESAPAPSVTAPAALPPETGIDGEGIQEGIAPEQARPDGLADDPELWPDDVVAVPEAGTDTAHERGPPEPGVGGETFVHSPAWKGNVRLSAGYRYSSGTLHAAWDVAHYRGTPLYAAKAGTIVGGNWGVKNQPAGYNPGSGSPSNWLLLCAKTEGRWSVLYYQHLGPKKWVKRGQEVKRGQRIATSGNTGNSTGDHTHFSSSFLPTGWTCSNITKARAEYLRYDYLRTPAYRVFAPDRFWKGGSRDLTVRPIRPGETSKKVCTLKKRLGMPAKSCTYGTKAQTKVIELKRRHGLNPTPVVGQRAWNAIT